MGIGHPGAAFAAVPVADDRIEEVVVSARRQPDSGIEPGIARLPSNVFACQVNCDSWEASLLPTHMANGR